MQADCFIRHLFSCTILRSPDRGQLPSKTTLGASVATGSANVYESGGLRVENSGDTFAPQPSTFGCGQGRARSAPVLEQNSVDEQLRWLTTLVQRWQREVRELRRENAELRCERGYWKSMHARAVDRNTKLQAELDQAKAEIRQLKAERFGKQSEKQSSTPSLQSSPRSSGSGHSQKEETRATTSTPGAEAKRLLALVGTPGTDRSGRRRQGL